MIRWYVVQTQPRKERLAEQNLQNQGFVTFCPNRGRHRKIGRRMVHVIEPFFPNYLFVALNLERQRWRSINGTIGVTRLVSFGKGRDGLPAAMPDGLVERFQTQCDERGMLQFDEPLLPGDRVRIIGGPFDALCGTLARVEPSDRVTVLLDFLSRRTQVRMSSRRLVAA